MDVAGVRELVRGVAGAHEEIEVFAAAALCSGVMFLSFFLLGAAWMPGPAAAKGAGSDDRVKLASYAVSTAHAAVASFGGLYCFLVDDGGAYSRPDQAAFGRSAPRHFFLVLTGGYLFYDAVLCLVFRRALFSVLTIVHHALILVAFGVGVASGSGTYYMAAFLVNELSTLPLNANYFMAASPAWRNSALYKLNGVLLLVSYAVFRVAFNFWCLHHLIFRTWVPYQPVVWPSLTAAQKVIVSGNSFLAFVHAFINLVWFRDIVVAVRRKLARPRASAPPPAAGKKTN